MAWVVARLIELTDRLGLLVTRERARGYSIIVLSLLAVLAGFSFATGPGMLDRFGQVKGADFYQFYAAGRMLADGQGASLYEFVPPFSFPAQEAVQAAVLAPQLTTKHYAFVIPPYYALLFVPLSYLPYLTAYGVWLVINIALYLGAILSLRSRLALLHDVETPVVCLVAMAFFPFLACLLNGQNAVFSFALVVLVYGALTRGREVAAGVALGCLVYKPQLMLVLLLFLLVSRRWRAIASTGVTAGALAALSWPLVGSKGVADFAALSRGMLDWVFIPGFQTDNMHSLYSFFALLLREPVGARVATVITTLPILALLLWAWRRCQSLDYQFALAGIATVLVSPHIFVYDLTLLVLPAIIIVDSLVSGRLPGRPATIRALLGLGFVVPFFSRYVASYLRVQLSVPVIVALFIVVALAVARAPSGNSLNDAQVGQTESATDSDARASAAS